jgi:hypothetical protein
MFDLFHTKEPFSFFIFVYGEIVRCLQGTGIKSWASHSQRAVVVHLSGKHEIWNIVIQVTV